jgi:hypothetical protein
LHYDGIYVKHCAGRCKSTHQLEINMTPIVIPPIYAAETYYIYLVLVVHLAYLHRLAVLLFGNANSPIAILDTVFH